MANERQKQMMQEALDAALSAEALQHLRQELDSDVRLAGEFKRLRQVDHLLKTAPFERAPERLAVKIMAALAESLKQQENETDRQALALALALVMLVTMPLLVTAISLFLLAANNPAALAAVIEQIIGLLSLVISMLEAFLQQAQGAFAGGDETPALLLALLPVAVYGLLRVMYDWGQEQPRQAEE